MSLVELKSKILDRVKVRGHVSFAELISAFPEEKGEYEMALPKYENIILWQGMSLDLCQAVQELQADGDVHFHPASQLTYLADGRSLNIPIAKSAHQYKKPHWFPMTIHHSPYEAS